MSNDKSNGKTLYKDDARKAESLRDILEIGTVKVSGNVAAEPELRFTESGKAVASVYFAGNKVGRPVESGEERQRTTRFFQVTLWEEDAEKFCDQFDKGSAVEFHGYLKSDSYTNKEGEEVKNPTMVASYFQIPYWAKSSASASDDDLD